jgi:hypothetical protein
MDPGPGNTAHNPRRHADLRGEILPLPGKVVIEGLGLRSWRSTDRDVLWADPIDKPHKGIM